MTTKYAPPAIEVIDGVASDKSQDADWLRARYFEALAEIEILEQGPCRFNCRTAKQNWIAGALAILNICGDNDPDTDTEVAENEWKRRQA